MVTIRRSLELEHGARGRQLDRAFGALADKTRRAIVHRLVGGDYAVGELAAPFRMSRPAISKHLRVLERAGLVRRRREGRITRCVLETAALRAIADWVAPYEVFWSEAFATERRRARTSSSNP